VCLKHDTTCSWEKGRSGNPGKKLADRLARIFHSTLGELRKWSSVTTSPCHCHSYWWIFNQFRGSRHASPFPHWFRAGGGGYSVLDEPANQGGELVFVRVCITHQYTDSPGAANDDSARFESLEKATMRRFRLKLGFGYLSSGVIH
jgi:hypothetical protein